ncbi:MAG: hypothetical protein Q9178_002889, partial [Gyalolechia marmorata]
TSKATTVKRITITRMRKSWLLFLGPLTGIRSTTYAIPTYDLTTIGQSNCTSNSPADRASCALSILNGFPNDIGVNQFHRGEPANFHQLPRIAIGGTGVDEQCRVTVDLIGEGPVQDSWHHVWTMASMLMDACANSSSGRTGGQMITGQGSGLTITIEKP